MDGSGIPLTGTVAQSVRGWAEIRNAIDRVLAKRLFFVGGFPKSGTTWLRWMLDAHPEISCAGEGHFANRFGPSLLESLQNHNKLIDLKNRTIFKGQRPFPIFDEADFRYLLASSIAILMDKASDPTARIIGEKTPDNLTYFAALAALFPDAKFVHIVRDPRDCSVSAWFHNHRTNPKALLERFGTFPKYTEHTAAAWTKAIEQGAEFARTYPGRCFLVRYEDLLEAPLRTLGPLIAFLGAAASPQNVQSCITNTAFEKFSDGRKPGDEDRSSFFRRGLAQDWKNHFSDEANRAFLAACGPQMAAYGYR